VVVVPRSAFRLDQPRDRNPVYVLEREPSHGVKEEGELRGADTRAAATFRAAMKSS
jgi:hypothetical protein